MPHSAQYVGLTQCQAVGTLDDHKRRQAKSRSLFLPIRFIIIYQHSRRTPAPSLFSSMTGQLKRQSKHRKGRLSHTAR